MKRRNYTREILAQMEEGNLVAVNAVGPETVLTLSPRSKTDPRPWTNGTYRYSGREVYAKERCTYQLWGAKHGLRRCTKEEGHEKAHIS